MKKISLIFLCYLVLLFLFLSHYTTSARLLQSAQDEHHEISTLNPLEEEDIANLMGLEECEENDNVCVKRRMVAEAHLDYIYTQRNKSHKP